MLLYLTHDACYKTCYHCWPVSSLPAAKGDNNKCAVPLFHFSLSGKVLCDLKRKDANDSCMFETQTNDAKYMRPQITPTTQAGILLPTLILIMGASFVLRFFGLLRFSPGDWLLLFFRRIDRIPLFPPPLFNFALLDLPFLVFDCLNLV